MPVTANEPQPDDRNWIEQRFGKPTTMQRSVHFPGLALVSIWIAAVPLYTGIAVGAGPTEDAALTALAMDLRGELKVSEIPL